jgi:hypothetical protein
MLPGISFFVFCIRLGRAQRLLECYFFH